jgi:hypothetical protein
MTLIGAGIIGFLLGLVFCFWKQLKSAYDNRETIGAAGDVATGIAGVQKLWEKI